MTRAALGSLVVAVASFAAALPACTLNFDQYDPTDGEAADADVDAPLVSQDSDSSGGPEAESGVAADAGSTDAYARAAEASPADADGVAYDTAREPVEDGSNGPPQDAAGPDARGGGADARPPQDAAPSPDVDVGIPDARPPQDASPDAADDATGAADASPDVAPCTPSSACLATAGTCAGKCEQNYNGCAQLCIFIVNSCKQACANTEQTCLAQCATTCTSCTTQAGCPASAACLDAG
ncbi:MAG: hypothetical protein ABTD50_07215 [Polyangiaceae bacterium]|jgi:hypothetical protein